MAEKEKPISDISFRGEIAGKQIVSSGSIVSHSGDDIVIYPFVNDPDFKTVVTVAFAETAEPSVDILDDDPESKRARILFRRKFKSGEFFSNTVPLNFAITDDGDEDYLVNFAINAFGVDSRFTLMLHFTVFKQKAVR